MDGYEEPRVTINPALQDGLNSTACSGLQDISSSGIYQTYETIDETTESGEPKYVNENIGHEDGYMIPVKNVNDPGSDMYETVETRSRTNCYENIDTNKQ